MNKLMIMIDSWMRMVTTPGRLGHYFCLCLHLKGPEFWARPLTDAKQTLRRTRQWYRSYLQRV